VTAAGGEVEESGGADVKVSREERGAVVARSRMSLGVAGAGEVTGMRRGSIVV